MRGDSRVITIYNAALYMEGRPLRSRVYDSTIYTADIFDRCTVPQFLFDYTAAHGSARYRILLTGLWQIGFTNQNLTPRLYIFPM